MEQARAHVSQPRCGRPAVLAREIVARHLDELIVPYAYDEALAQPAAPRAAAEDAIIASLTR